jgi:hypothetical protein
MLAVPEPVAEEIQGRAMGSVVHDSAGLEHLAIARALDRQGDKLAEALLGQIRQAGRDTQGLHRLVLALVSGEPVDPIAMLDLVNSILGTLSASLLTLSDIRRNDTAEQAHWDREAPRRVGLAREEAREISRLVDEVLQ